MITSILVFILSFELEILANHTRNIFIMKERCTRHITEDIKELNTCSYFELNL